jgi:glycylpeptide N-tetradecanoyltransferase
MSPGWTPEWHVGVRVSTSRKLVAFISAVPIELRVRKKVLHASEVNFLSIHKKLRGKRLTPILIKEITRRCYLRGTWQAVYTAGVVLPKPVSTSRYFHRTIYWEKLHEIGFSPMPPHSTPQKQILKYNLPSQTAVKGLRPMEAKDIDSVLSLLRTYLERFDMAPVFTREEVEHWLLHKGGDQVVWSYVVEVSHPSY